METGRCGPEARRGAGRVLSPGRRRPEDGVFEAPEGEAERAIVVIKRVMEGAADPVVALTVPLVVEARAAANWDEAH